MTARLPSLLVVGAQKSGTTTLCADLEECGLATFGRVKESRALLKPNAADSRRIYERNYDGLPLTGHLADGSTDYAKRTVYPEVALRAHDLLGAAPLVIYIMRDPIDRLKSHFAHDVARGLLSGSIADAVSEGIDGNTDLVDNGRYYFQLAPWIEQFFGRVLPVCFEDYTANRELGIDAIAAFLGHDSAERIDRVPSATVHNKAGDMLPARGRWRSLVEHDLYRHSIRRYLPQRVRDSAKSAFFGRAEAASTELDDTSLEALRDVYVRDAQLLTEAFPDFVAPWLPSD